MISKQNYINNDKSSIRVPEVAEYLCLAHEKISYLYTFALKSKYGSWNSKIRQIYEQPVDHPKCNEVDQFFFAYDRAGQTLSNKLVNNCFWTLKKITACTGIRPLSDRGQSAHHFRITNFEKGPWNCSRRQISEILSSL